MGYRHRTRTVVKSRYQRTGPRSTTPLAYRNKPGIGGRRSISSALRYLQTRPLGQDEKLEDRMLFDRSRGGVRRAEAREDLAERVTRGVAYHSMVLSPGLGAERMTREEMKEWTRDVMAGVEQRLGRELIWYAVVHRHNQHPHVHVIVAASSQGLQSRRKSVRFSREDFRFMREQGDRHADRLQRDAALLRVAQRYLFDTSREPATPLRWNVVGGSGGGALSGRDRVERARDERERER